MEGCIERKEKCVRHHARLASSPFPTRCLIVPRCASNRSIPFATNDSEVTSLSKTLSRSTPGISNETTSDSKGIMSTSRFATARSAS